MVCGTFIMRRGTSSPETPYTLAHGGPKAPLRSRGSLAALARGKSTSQALTPIEIGPVVQAGDPEHDADQDEEQKHGHRDDLRREAQGGRERVDRIVPNDAVAMPGLADPGANVAHEPHEPGEGDRDEDQHVLRDRRNLSPAYFGGLRPTVEEDINSGDRQHREKDRKDLRHGKLDPDRRLDEVPVDAEGDKEDRDRREDRELHREAGLRPRHRRDLPGATVEEEAHEGREDQDVHGGVLRGPLPPRDPPPGA